MLRKAYGPLSSWEAEASFPDYPGVAVHIWYARGKWRQEWRANGLKSSGVGVGGTVLASCVGQAFPLSPLFAWMPPDTLQTWHDWGVDNATRTFGFCGDVPCFMYGADPEDMTLPAVWLNNETMAPLLVRYEAGGGQASIAFSDFRTLGGYDVPQKVIYTAPGAEPLVMAVKWLAVNRAGDASLYDPKALARTLSPETCGAMPEPFDRLGNEFRFPVVR